MPAARCLPVLLAVLLGSNGLSVCLAAEKEAREKATLVRARPAVLVLRVSEVEDSGRKVPRFELLKEKELARLRDKLEPEVGLSEGRADPEAPRLGPGFEWVRTYVPDTEESAVRYYVYHLNLNDPGLADKWRKLRRTERKEQREDRASRRNERNWQRRKLHLIGQNTQAAREGVAFMREGEYRQAVISLTRATLINEADPVSRIHLAQARVALGHDAEAARVLRRALELQPKLVPMQFDLGQYYPSDEGFHGQVDALAERLADNKAATAEEFFLLGFMQFQRSRMDEAHAAFRRAERGLSKDEKLQLYLTLTKPATPECSQSEACDAGRRPMLRDRYP